MILILLRKFLIFTFLHLPLTPQKDVDGNVQFPIMHSVEDEIFYTFGQDWKYRGYLFPAFIIPATGEREFALKVRLSVFDTRTDPQFEPWTEWEGCEGQGQQ
jgi:hypothetical protein